MRYEASLSTKSINSVIRELKKRRQELEGKMIKEFFFECCRTIISYANDNIRDYPIGNSVLFDIMTNWEYAENFTGDRIVLRNKAEKAAYVEFGVGVVAENAPHPIADEVGYDYNIPSLAKRQSANTIGYGTRQFEDGTWIFYQDQDKLDLPPSALDDRIYFNEPTRDRSRMLIRTRGTEPTMFLFNAVLRFVSAGDAKRLWAEIKQRYWG